MEIVEISELERGLYAYEMNLRDKELSEISIKKYLGDIKRFLKYLKKEIVNTVSTETMWRYRDFIYQNYSANSYNSYFISLNAYFRFLDKSFLYVKLCRVPRRQSLENVITLGEYNRLLEYTLIPRYEVIHMIIRTLGCTGIRISELRYVTIEAVRMGRTEVMAKKRTRMIYFSQDLSEKLLAYCRRREITQGIIFCSKTSGRPLDSGNIWRMLKVVAVRAGVDEKKVYPHSFRHLFAKTYIERFHALDELADLLGHSSIETTRIYTRTTGEEKRGRLNMLGL